MRSDAPVAALGVATVAAVHPYRLEVIALARRRRLPLVSKTLPISHRPPAATCKSATPPTSDGSS